MTFAPQATTARPAAPPPAAWLTRLPKRRAAALAAAAGGVFVAGTVWVLLALAGSAAPPWLAPLAGALAGAALYLPALAGLSAVRRLQHSLLQSRLDLVSRDLRDELTGAFTQHHFAWLASRECARALRYGEGAAVLLLDVDHFEVLERSLGARCAESVLRDLAQQTLPMLRVADALGRHGRSEFTVFLAQADPTGALDVAERIRESVSQREFTWEGERLRVTLSIGVACLPARVGHAAVTAGPAEPSVRARHALPPAAPPTVAPAGEGAPPPPAPPADVLGPLLAAARRALHAAHIAGRNCVRASDAAPVPPLPSGVPQGGGQTARGEGAS
jgi:diguanylate cyclase